MFEVLSTFWLFLNSAYRISRRTLSVGTLGAQNAGMTTCLLYRSKKSGMMFSCSFAFFFVLLGLLSEISVYAVSVPVSPSFQDKDLSTPLYSRAV